MIFGIIIVVIVGVSPPVAGLRESDDHERVVARHAKQAQILVLGFSFCIFGILYMVFLTYFFPSS